MRGRSIALESRHVAERGLLGEPHARLRRRQLTLVVVGSASISPLIRGSTPLVPSSIAFRRIAVTRVSCRRRPASVAISELAVAGVPSVLDHAAVRVGFDERDGRRGRGAATGACISAHASSAVGIILLSYADRRGESIRTV